MRLQLRPNPQTKVVAIAILSVLALAGCSAEVNIGGGSEASGEEIAGEIRKAYADRTGIELSSLTCESVNAEVGDRFSCSGRNGRSIQLEIAGRVTDSTAGEIDYNWRVAKAIAPGVLYERALRGSIEEGGVALAEVRCPVEVEIRVGSKLRCTATDRNGASRGVTLRLTDLDGGFDYSVDGERPAQESATS
jgi:hypothetical protein